MSGVASKPATAKDDRDQISTRLHDSLHRLGACGVAEGWRDGGGAPPFGCAEKDVGVAEAERRRGADSPTRAGGLVRLERTECCASLRLRRRNRLRNALDPTAQCDGASGTELIPEVTVNCREPQLGAAQTREQRRILPRRVQPGDHCHILDLSGTTDMHLAFNRAEQLTTVHNICNWDLSGAYAYEPHVLGCELVRQRVRRLDDSALHARSIGAIRKRGLPDCAKLRGSARTGQSENCCMVGRGSCYVARVRVDSPHPRLGGLSLQDRRHEGQERGIHFETRP